jgi:hypothetical protein
MNAEYFGRLSFWLAIKQAGYIRSALVRAGLGGVPGRNEWRTASV